jgi:hypothetical protein
MKSEAPRPRSPRMTGAPLVHVDAEEIGPGGVERQ